MRVIFLGFEGFLFLVWSWSTLWMLGMLRSGDGDGGTFIGMLLFLAFAVGTAWMIVHEIRLYIRQRSASNQATIK